jgi:hypothetical protein
MKYLLYILLGMVCPFSGIAQEESYTEHPGMKGSHRLTIGMTHTHISTGRIHEKTEWIVAPSVSLNYDYWLSNKWAIGLQNDIIMETFVIENTEEEEIEREYPLAVVPVALFKPGKHFSFVGGIGVEFENTGNLLLTRLGVEYGVELPKNWEAGLALVWDNAWDHYNSWGISFAFSKIFSKNE